MTVFIPIIVSRDDSLLTSPRLYLLDTQFIPQLLKIPFLITGHAAEPVRIESEIRSMLVIMEGTERCMPAIFIRARNMFEFVKYVS